MYGILVSEDRPCGEGCLVNTGRNPGNIYICTIIPTSNVRYDTVDWQRFQIELWSDCLAEV